MVGELLKLNESRFGSVSFAGFALAAAMVMFDGRFKLLNIASSGSGVLGTTNLNTRTAILNVPDGGNQTAVNHS